MKNLAKAVRKALAEESEQCGRYRIYYKSHQTSLKQKRKQASEKMSY